MDAGFQTAGELGDYTERFILCTSYKYWERTKGWGNYKQGRTIVTQWVPEEKINLVQLHIAFYDPRPCRDNFKSQT